MTLWSWKTQPNSHAQRKFIELIFDRTGKYANWDPLPKFRIDKHTGNLSVEGNIYSDDFKQLLVDAGINPESDEHHAKDCPDESEFKTWSKNVKCIDMNLSSHAGVPEISAASIKGTWQVKKGATGAVLLMNNPRIKHITSDALGKLARIKLLQSMHLVTKVFYCPAFSLYLSDTSAGGEKISMALVASAPIVEPIGALEAKASMKWWSDTQTGLARHGCNTEHCFTPPAGISIPRTHRRTVLTEGRARWIPAPVPWAPLREDGSEVPIYVNYNLHQGSSRCNAAAAHVQPNLPRPPENCIAIAMWISSFDIGAWLIGNGSIRN
ncbi:uncharacterized protein EDB93DRAFT_1108410 [Suillus bovinus]|uniref:uncharacterized protein n=1 Tax=Suillus bovinus TaxID=48563 RepID=UPI001B88018E|nr:uncharacterized protein EDB93DRAFT_1108410 [Suillus bovinus]KAG2130421.1 hypothetical protein EDB93DRAFT_1108410 [Suillus bovinus]